MNNSGYTETFKTGEIISQHHLNLKTNTFAKNLPLVDSDQICPYDGSKMRIKLLLKHLWIIGTRMKFVLNAII